MKLISIKKIGDDWGGDNLLFTIHIKNNNNRYIKSLKGLGHKLNDILWDINRNYETDFQWDYEVSYDNMDYNGYFLSTVYIDKDNLTHKMDDDKVIITDNFIIDLIMGDCDDLLTKLVIKYQEMLWSKINYEDDIYEQFLDNEVVSYKELCDLEDLANHKITLQKFAKKQGYKWEIDNMQNEQILIDKWFEYTEDKTEYAPLQNLNKLLNYIYYGELYDDEYDDISSYIRNVIKDSIKNSDTNKKTLLTYIKDDEEFLEFIGDNDE